MLRCSFSALLALLALGLMSSRAYCADAMAASVVAAPSACCAVAGGEPAAWAAQQYFYVEFPRQAAAVQREIELAEMELALIARHLETYRPTRSFGRYAATYTADQAWQVALIAATQRLESLRQQEIDLWRQRRISAEQWIQSAPR